MENTSDTIDCYFSLYAMLLFFGASAFVWSIFVFATACQLWYDKRNETPYQERWRDGPYETRQPGNTPRCQFPKDEDRKSLRLLLSGKTKMHNKRVFCMFALEKRVGIANFLPRLCGVF